MVLALCIAGWLACSVLAYIFVRIDHRRDGFAWTVGNRRSGLFISLLFGPLAALIVGLDLLSSDPDKPARW